MSRDKVVQAEQRICDAVLLLECIEEKNLPEKYRERFVEIYDDLCGLWDELARDMYPEGKSEIKDTEEEE